MGGMAAQIPIKNDVQANEQAMEKVRADKLREVRDGHDGTWVAHPGLVPIAMDIFNEHMPSPNQLEVRHEDLKISARDLLLVPEGQITESGVQTNVAVGLRYLESWLRGNGCVPIFNLMEDAATAEISRAQLWQWIRHGGQTTAGKTVTVDTIKDALATELEQLRMSLGDAYSNTQFDAAAELFLQVSTADQFVDFLTLPAYEQLA